MQGPLWSEPTKVQDPALPIADDDFRIAGDADLQRLSSMVDKRLAKRVEKCNYLFGVSKSAVVEAALLTFFHQHPNDDAVGESLEAVGAARRRR